MIIENLTERQQLICDLLWNCGGITELNRMMMHLPREDHPTAQALIAVMGMGGDHVSSVNDAAEIIEMIQQRSKSQ